MNSLAAFINANLKYSEKEVKKNDLKKQLEEGTVTDCSILYEGKIGGNEFGPIGIKGILKVGKDSDRAARDFPKIKYLLAYLLSQMSERHRKKVLNKLESNYMEEILNVDECVLAELENLSSKIRNREEFKVSFTRPITFDYVEELK